MNGNKKYGEEITKKCDYDYPETLRFDLYFSGILREERISGVVSARWSLKDLPLSKYYFFKSVCKVGNGFIEWNGCPNQSIMDFCMFSTLSLLNMTTEKIS